MKRFILINSYLKRRVIPLSCFSGEERLFAKNEHYNRGEVKSQTAFTLAEVLITLTIIGVIAALTIPNLMQKWQDHAEITAVKKAYSVIDNAIKMAIAENGPMEDWGWPVNDDTGYSAENSLYFFEKIKPHLKIEKYCGTNTGCYVPASKALNGQNVPSGHLSFNNSRAQRFILQDGIYVAISSLTVKYYYGATRNVRPEMYDSKIIVDINGKKGPNRIGYDTFSFGLSYNGLVPDSCIWESRIVNGCTITEQNAWNGCSCYYWIWKHNNMDYKYRDVSAEW